MDRAQRRMIEAKMKAMRKPIDELRCSPCTISPERPRPPKSCDPDGTAIHPKPWGTNKALGQPREGARRHRRRSETPKVDFQNQKHHLKTTETTITSARDERDIDLDCDE